MNARRPGIANVALDWNIENLNISSKTLKTHCFPKLCHDDLWIHYTRTCQEHHQAFMIDDQNEDAKYPEAYQNKDKNTCTRNPKKNGECITYSIQEERKKKTLKRH